jgi:nucleoside-diphosphate-sugar epimerase
LKEALQQGTITLFGEGAEKRSHIFVEDVVKFIDKALHYQSTGCVNLCPSPTISFGEVAQAIKEVLPQKIDIIMKPGASEITHRYFDNTFLQQAFPDFSFTDIKTGIQKTLIEISN